MARYDAPIDTRSKRRELENMIRGHENLDLHAGTRECEVQPNGTVPEGVSMFYCSINSISD